MRCKISAINLYTNADMVNPRFQKAIMLLLISAVISVTFFHLIREIRDPDFFWHLKTGQWIWQHGEIPVKDPFSFTTEGLQSVREHFIMSSYWLTQGIFWLFYRLAGMPGIVFLRFLIVGSLLFVMMKRREGDSTLYAGLLLLFLGLLLNSYPIERPQVFSFLFFALLLYLLKRVTKEKISHLSSPARPKEGNFHRRDAEGAEKAFEGHPEKHFCFPPSQRKTNISPTLRSLRLPDKLFFLLFPLLMLVWANMHAGYVVGAATIVLFIAVEGIKFVRPALRPMEKGAYKMLIIAGVMGLLTSFINPNTYHVFSENILFQHDYVIFNNIEFQSTVRIFMRYHDASIIVYWLMLALAIAGLLISIKKIDITEAALLASLGYFSFNSIRYVAFFMIAALPVVGRTFSEGKLRRPAQVLVLAGSLITAVFFTGDHVNFESLSSGRWIDERKFPVGAADFILSNDLKGNMYNYFDWGGYLIWRLAPERKVFIDGRTLYSHTYLQSDLIDKADERRFEGMPAWKAALDEHNIQYTITPGSLPLVKALSEDRDWIPVFSHYNSVIFVRDRPENRKVIEKYSLDKGRFLR